MPLLRRQLSDDAVNRLLDATKSPRYRMLERYQAFYEGTQYVGRAPFLDRQSDVPTYERAPCVAFPLTKVAIESSVAFAIGEGKFPMLSSMSSEDDSAFDATLGLNPGDSAVVDQFTARLVDICRLPASLREAAKKALAAKSVAIVCGYRAGYPFADAIWSKICTPAFDPNDPDAVVKLTIRYRYRDDVWDVNQGNGGAWIPVVKEYLRIIDPVNDTVYLPVEIWDDSDKGPQEGSGATQSVVAHGFGFCPVVWYGCMRESGQVDGTAVHENKLPMLEALDMALSQRHRAAFYAGDPQWVLTGVSGDESIGSSGRTMRPQIFPGDKPSEWSRALYFGGPQSGGAIRKGPGEIWRIESPDAKATLYTLPGDALKAIDDHARDLLKKLCDALGVVLIDPSQMNGSGDLSGRTLAFIFSSQLNRVAQFRDDYGRRCILPVVFMLYRMLLAQSTGVYLPGLAKVLPILKRFVVVDSSGVTRWIAPNVKLIFGAYFEPSDTDEATRVTTSAQALTGGLITTKSAIQHIKGVFEDIQDVSAYADAVAAEKLQRQTDAINNAAAMASAVTPAAAPGATPGAPANAQNKAAARPAIVPAIPKRSMQMQTNFSGAKSGPGAK